MGSQGGLSRNKVAVGGSAAGSPPSFFLLVCTGYQIQWSRFNPLGGPVDQLVDRPPCTREASGSNPDGSISSFNKA
jgi:hypothetical protein